MQFRTMLAVAAIAGTSCTQTRTTDCQDEKIRLHFKAFAPEELDTVLINRYAAGSGFSRVERTDTLLGPPANAVFHEDTVSMIFNYRWMLSPGADYEIEVLSTGSRTRIWDIQQEEEKTQTYRQAWGGGGVVHFCINSITAFTIDNIRISYVPETDVVSATVIR